MTHFPHRRAGHCGSGALRDLLEHHGLSYVKEPASEGMAFGLGGGLGFFYADLPDLEPPFYLVGRTAGLEKDFCQITGVDLDLRHTDDPGEGWRWLREELDQGRPTMVNADIKHLDYLRVRMHNTMHDIVVTGYDEERAIAFVADNDRDEIQECSLESLAQARGSEAFPGPSHHATWLMRFPDRLPAPHEAVGRALSLAIANMRGGGEPLAGASVGSGLEGVSAFEQSYRAWPERLGDRLHAALRGLRVFIVKAGTGGAMFRSLHAEFLEDASALLDDDALRKAASVYRDLASAWVELAQVAGGEDPAESHRAGVPVVARVAALERAGVEALERSVIDVTA